MALRAGLIAALLFFASALDARSANSGQQLRELRAQVHECQDTLGVDRSPVSRMVPIGPRYRAWVVTLWETRREAFCGALRAVRRLYSYDEAAGARAWAESSGPRCVSSHEGAVTSNTGNGYYGKWQADITFQVTYGAEYYRRWGVASNWPEWAQDVMARRGYLDRGWGPWPTTSVMCGLR